jgi:hypothetical protein
MKKQVTIEDFVAVHRAMAIDVSYGNIEFADFVATTLEARVRKHRKRFMRVGPKDHHIAHLYVYYEWDRWLLRVPGGVQ